MIHSYQESLAKLRSALQARPKSVGDPFDNWANPPLNVLDCVLSLNRRYEEFCLPRVQRFAEAHPEIQQLAAFRSLIVSYPTPLKFSETELNYRDQRRADVLLGVTEYLLRQLRAFPATSSEPSQSKSEMASLGAWAQSARPEDARSTGVHGFGLAGFQYLRMLFGAQTAKPDIHIRRFVADAVRHRVSDAEALTLLEAAAREEGLRLADLDYSIWQELSGSAYPKPRTPNSCATTSSARQPKTNLAKFLLDSPLPGSGLKVERRKDTPRPIEL